MFEPSSYSRCLDVDHHAFVWTAAAGMVEMSSLGGLNVVSAMSANGSFSRSGFLSEMRDE
jgi:hypothetical protein